jgi:hypothetical protein
MTTRRALLPLVLLLLAGCGLFSRTKNHFYALDRIPPTAPIAAITGTPIGIDTLELPPGYDRREMVVRKTDGQLDVRGTEQWSASLQPLLLHTLASDLADRLAPGMVILPGQAKPLTMRSITIAIEDLTIGPDNTVTMDARWTLDTTAHHERISVPIDKLDGTNIAAGLSRTAAELADRMAGQVGAR